MIETRRTTLTNGLNVITREVHHVPIASFWVWYRVGSRNEIPGLTGISHWVEHMMFKGTPTIEKGEIFRLVNANGGVLNGFTWLDYTAYFETLPSSRVQLSIDIESERMASSVFDPNEVSSERTVIISEREGSENSPHFLLGEELGSAAFQSHPYGHSVIGWKTDLQTMTREDLYAHYKTYYTPNNATVVVVGDFDTNELLGQIREKFESIPSGPEAPPVRAVEPPQRGERRVVVRYPAGVPYLEIAYRAPAAADVDAFPLMVLDAVLSGGKPMGMFGSRGTRMGRSSRLYRGLVDSGLASGAGSSFALTRDPYLFEIDASLRPGVTLEVVEKSAFQEVERLQQERVGEEELKRAVKQVKAQFVYASESVTDQGYWLGSMETIGTPEVYERMIERVEAVTAEEVQRVAQQYLTDSRRTVGWLIPSGKNGAGGDAGPAGARPFFYSGGTRETATSGGPQPISLTIHRTELPNGVVVLVNQDDTTPQVIVRASLLAGSAFDAPDKAGIARFVAPMLIRGTESRSFQELSEETDSMGMALNTETGRLTSQVSIRCLKEDLPRGMEILAEVLRRASLPDDEVEKLRMQIIAGLREQETSARSVAERKFLELLYPPGHPYRLWPSGTQDTVGTISRDDLLAFYRRYYRPDTLIVSIVGDTSVEHAVEQVRRVLGDWGAEGEKPRLEIPAVDLPVPSLDEEVVEGKFQSEMVLGLPALSRNDPDYYALRLGNLILGELGLSGRLGADIREKQGLAYHVSSDLQASVGPSPWAIRAGVNPSNVDKAVESARAEIERWRDRPVTTEELEEGKSYVVGSLPIALETVDGVARTMLDIEFYKLGLDFLERYPELINAVTPDSIQAAVRKWIIPDHIVTVVAGPARQG